MPAPETNSEATWEYLLRRNADLAGVSFALGAEDAIYLVGRVPVSASTTTSSTASSGHHWPTPTSAFRPRCPSGTRVGTAAAGERPGRPLTFARSGSRSRGGEGLTGSVRDGSKLLVVGGGKMGGALVTGLLGARWASVDISGDRDRSVPAALLAGGPPRAHGDRGAGGGPRRRAGGQPDVAEDVARTLVATGARRMLRSWPASPRHGSRPRCPTAASWCGPCPTRPR